MNILIENLEKLIDAPKGIEKARELILQLAVQGKLVKQDSNDERSEVLVKRIKGKSLKQISDHQEGNELILPQGWSWQIIDNIVLDDKHSIKRGPFGSSIKKDFFVPKGIKVYEQKHAIKNDFEIGSYFINEEKYQELKAFEVKPNDIIISCSGTIGKVAIVPKGAAKGIINQALLKLSLNTKLLLNEYFLILFPAYFMQTETLDEVKGTAIKNIVSVKELKSLPFPLPPINEQNRIVEKVNSLMSLLDEIEEKRERKIQRRIKLNNASLEKLLTSKDDKELITNWKRIEENFSTLYSVPENVEKLKQAILQLAVQGKLVKQDPNDEPASELLKKIKKEKEKFIAEGKIKKQNGLFLIVKEEYPFILPKGWLFERIGNIFFTTSGGTPSRGNFSYWNGDIPWLKSGELDDNMNISQTEEFITEDGLRNSSAKLFEKGSVVIALYGATAGKVGILGIDTTTNQAVCNFYRTSYILNTYLFYFLKANRSKIIAECFGGAQPNISQDYVKKMIFALPPLAEQKRIVEKVNELMGLCNTLEEKLKKKEATAEKLVGAVVGRISKN